MVRQGTLAFLIIGLAACTQDVDDPANFTAGNSQGQTSGSSSSTGGADTDSATGVASGGGTTMGNPTTAGQDTTAGMGTTGPAPGNCGNGIIDMGEQCDGADLQGFTCNDLGLGGGGTLACDPGMCTFDTSMCMSTTGPTSG